MHHDDGRAAQQPDRLPTRAPHNAHHARAVVAKVPRQRRHPSADSGDERPANTDPWARALGFTR